MCWACIHMCCTCFRYDVICLLCLLLWICLMCCFHAGCFLVHVSFLSMWTQASWARPRWATRLDTMSWSAYMLYGAFQHGVALSRLVVAVGPSTFWAFHPKNAFLDLWGTALLALCISTDIRSRQRLDFVCVYVLSVLKHRWDQNANTCSSLFTHLVNRSMNVRPSTNNCRSCTNITGHRFQMSECLICGSVPWLMNLTKSGPLQCWMSSSSSSK